MSDTLTSLLSGNNLITGFSDADALAGGLGDDAVRGLSGDDTYIFTRGDGHDVIDDQGYDAGDKLDLRGYTPGEVKLLADGPAILILTLRGGGTAGGGFSQFVDDGVSRQKRRAGVCRSGAFRPAGPTSGIPDRW